MEEKKKISSAVIRRLPRYYRYLGELIESGVQRISSKDLSVRMKVTASQIRQDLNNFGGFGQQGYGYNVKYLYDEIGKILGIDRKHNMIIIGAGNLGRAIVNYTDFEKRGHRLYKNYFLSFYNTFSYKTFMFRCVYTYIILVGKFIYAGETNIVSCSCVLCSWVA